jgi:hypothetical protein
MIPQKSLKIVMGNGAELKSIDHMGDLCAMRETRCYQVH